MDVGCKTNDELIAEHQDLVMSLAKRIHRNLPSHVRLEDIICYGQLGLTQAARSFRFDAGSSFSTFAYYRIRGAIFDGLVKMSWASRSAYQRLKADQLASEVAFASSEEGGAGSPTSEAEARWLARSSERLAVVYLMSGSDEQVADAWLEDVDADTPQQSAEKQELYGLLRDLVAGLPETERALMQMVYYEDLSLSDAAEKLGHTRSWASRVHARVLSRLSRDLVARDAV